MHENWIEIRSGGFVFLFLFVYVPLVVARVREIRYIARSLSLSLCLPIYMYTYVCVYKNSIAVANIRSQSLLLYSLFLMLYHINGGPSFITCIPSNIRICIGCFYPTLTSTRAFTT